MEPIVVRPELPYPTTRAELRTVLGHRSNRLAVKAVEVIALAEDFEAFKDLVDRGAAFTYYERVRGTQRFHSRNLLAKTFESFPASKVTSVTGGKRISIRLWPSSVAERGHETRLMMFRYLLQAGAQSSRNNWRGDLFQHVLSEACLHPACPVRFAFAQALVEERPVVLPHFVAHAYWWHWSLESLEVVERLGAKTDSEAALENCLSYLHCASTSRSTPESRRAVAWRLIGRGATIPVERAQRFWRGWQQSHVSRLQAGDFDILQQSCGGDPMLAS